MGKRGGVGRGRGRGKAGGRQSAADLLASLPPHLQRQIAVETTRSGPSPGVEVEPSEASLAEATAANQVPSASVEAKLEPDAAAGSGQAVPVATLSMSPVATPGFKAGSTFSFAQECERQSRSNTSKTPSEFGTASTSTGGLPAPSVSSGLDESVLDDMDMDSLLDDDVDPSLCPICKVEPKQSDKKRYCRAH